MKWLLSSYLISLLLVGNIYAHEVCFSVEDAKRLVVELEQKRILQQEVKEYEELVKNLKKQNELLQEQNKLLKEQIEIVKNQTELYKTAYEEEKKKKNLSFLEKGKWFGIGILAGLVLGIAH